MFDIKTQSGAKILIALVIAILIYGLLTPIISWYLDFVPGFITCDVTNVFCNFTNTMISSVIPIGVLFICMFSIFEVFSSGHRF